MMNELFTDDWALIGTIDPQTVSNTEVFTDVIDHGKFEQVAFVFALGNMASETITARVVTCDSAGNNAAAYKTATQLSASATANDNDQIIIISRAEDLPQGTNTDQYIKGGLVTGGATGGPSACMAFGRSRMKPASDFDLASVLEIETDLD